MADASDVLIVRRNTSELTEDNYTDEVIGTLIDSLGVAGASRQIWQEKASGYATLVTVSEAGASRQLSDLHKNAIAMIKVFQEQEVGETTTSARPRVVPIVRTS